MEPLLSENWRVIRIDLSGHGDSGHRDHYGTEVWGAEIFAVLDAAASDRAVLVGHSMGGRICLVAAAAHPRRVAGVVTLDSVIRPVARPARPLIPHPAVYASREEALARFRLLPDQPLPSEEFLLPVAAHSVRPVDGGWSWKHDPRGVPTVDDALLARSIAELRVLNLYGATEFAGGVAGWTIRDWETFRGQKRGSVGRANPGVRLRVVDQETGEPVPAGEIGVLEVASDRFGGTERVRTSDQARMDENGFLWIVGRVDDVIIRGGFKIQAEDVRIALESHPAVREASVVGVPDARLGDVPVAAVTVTEKDPVDGEELRAWLRQRLTAYQVPVDIRVVPELPRTAALKVPRSAIRALFGHP